MTDATRPTSNNSVFISYARADNEQPPDKKVEGWVSFFWNQLRFELTDRGAAEAKLWLDRYEIEPHEAFTPKIEQALKQAKLLLAILSRNWIQREWCQRELQLFFQLHAEDIERYIPVFKHPLARELLPSLMQNDNARTGYQFFEVESTGKTREFYWRGLKDETAYYDLVKTIAEAISNKLGIVRPAAMVPPVTATGQIVFIALAASDLRDARQRLVNDLVKNGIKVVPEADTSPDTAEAFVSMVKAGLSQAVFAVHLLGEKNGSTPEGATEPIVPLQLRLARAMPYHRILWVPRWHRTETGDKRNPVDVVTERFGELQQNEEIFGKEVTDLSQLLRERLKPASQAEERSSSAKFNLLLIAAAHPDDEELATELANAIQECNLNVQLFDPETYAELTTEASAVLIPWGMASQENLQALLTKLSPAPAKTVCLRLPGGNDAEKRRFFQKGIICRKIEALPDNAQKCRDLLESLEILPPHGNES
ncbi:toll/interleukin-1 receptor domain-containing protein [Nitrosomonas communis]|uniref:toll/interleukin-1 receptor domain-containing protein n=1 Tax=Nitrosomonas communis TaxID=44574 RepID=UPI0026EFB6EC|nr:toll/interleukin-1 receptor domain-containing protein [Nitrosomonas communis]MCO6426977.1 toll/interleukin-1 receptor domain-containing protein [Nitrosomonas communis]